MEEDEDDDVLDDGLDELLARSDCDEGDDDDEDAAFVDDELLEPVFEPFSGALDVGGLLSRDCFDEWMKESSFLLWWLSSCNGNVE